MTTDLQNDTDTADRVTLELTGPLENLVGAPSLDLPIGRGRIGDLLAELVERHPEARGHLAEPAELRRDDGSLPPGFLVIRDGAAVPARLESPIAAGERLTLLSMISGG